MNTLLPGIIKAIPVKNFIFSLLFLFLISPAFSQEIRINCTDEPLNKILIQLRDNYGLMVSFDDRQLSTYKLTVEKRFSSPEQTIDYLLKGLPFRYEVSEGVYIIYTFEVRVKPKIYFIAGSVSDRTSHETLPFSSILINNKGFISDARGNFSFTSGTDSIFSVKISYLGYYILDTVVPRGTHYNFRLTPSVISMQEVIVIGPVVERSIQTGNSPGVIKLNHKIAYYLPGNGDNSVFNLLRLQPGILASGEQSADLIIWGSYEGQSQVVYDGFTLYGMKNFNDNISAVNPFMAKDIKVLKGEFGAEYGERVGGIVDITGTDGSRLSPSVNLNINNMTLNGSISVPFRKKSSLLMAYRQTYYNLYNPVEYSSSGSGRGRQSSNADYYLVPDYIFRDMNLKYSGSGVKSNYYISLYSGRDDFNYSFDQEALQKSITLAYNEQNMQLGGAAFYGFRWKEKNTSNFTISYSLLKTDRDYQEEIVRTAGNQVFSNINEQTRNAIHEINGRIDNKIILSEKHTADAGAGLLYYKTDNYINTIRDTVDEHLLIPYFYLQDNILLLDNLTIRPGIRMNFHNLSGRIYFQPRISAVYRINEAFRLNAAAGMYNQFVAKNMIMDASANYKLAWSICGSKETAVLSSNSYSLGLSFNKHNFTASIEGYHRNTEGITRFLETETGTFVHEGDSRTKGLDIFVKKEFKNQSFWIAYTFSKTEEKFPYFPANSYLPAMHDQRHEFKMAGLAKIKSFHFSACYVFGSGFPDPDLLPDAVDYTQPYSRLDADLIYSISKRKIKIDAGISVLNVLNTENIRYSNYTRVPTDESTTVSLYAEAVPFTPALSLKITY
ncbi:MAG: carboxypeptidase-like regulatory domain-containing protein [Bacteroidales bacterium]|nr:carboxypeptidase-like regulatory domain-containing protein [Bacteroidales bacterium]